MFLFKISKNIDYTLNLCYYVYLRGDNVNVYDFDNTIYRGESTLDYYFFCVKHHPRLIRFVFVVVYELIRYKMCLVSEDELMSLCEKYVCSFLNDCPDSLVLAEKFWDKNIKKIKPFYYALHHENDVIISASFGFMLRPIMKKLGVKELLCSEVDLESGKIERLCFRRNKRLLFESAYKDKIENFYTDSLNDVPLMQMSKNAFLVKGDTVKRWRND